MKHFAIITGISCLTVSLLTGCSPSPETPEPAPQTPAPPATPATPAPPATNAAAQPSTPPQAATQPATIPALPAAPDPVQVLNQFSAQLASSDSVKNDSTLSDINGDIKTLVEALSQPKSADNSVRGVLLSTVSALAKGQDANAIAAYEKIAGAQLTPQQMTHAKDLKNAVSAFVVQRNFSNIEGAQSQVGQLVNAFRKGDSTTAIKALQAIGANAQLSDQQKNLLSALATQSGPAINQATEALRDKIKL